MFFTSPKIKSHILILDLEDLLRERSKQNYKDYSEFCQILDLNDPYDIKNCDYSLVNASWRDSVNRDELLLNFQSLGFSNEAGTQMLWSKISYVYRCNSKTLCLSHLISSDDRQCAYNSQDTTLRLFGSSSELDK